jgi:voltage-gated potassium channel Kch
MSTPTKDTQAQETAAPAPAATAAPKKTPSKPQKPAGKPFRRYIYEWLYKPKDGVATSKKFENYLSILIIANIACMILETIPALAAFERWLNYFELFSIIVFTAEYLIRLLIAPEEPEFKDAKNPRFKYLFSFFAIIDALVILPFYMGSLAPFDLRFLRILRLLRILKLLRVLLPAFEEFRKLNEGRTFRQRVHALVFPSPYGGQLHQYYDLFIVVWVLISVLAVILESVDSIYYNLAVEFVILDAVAVLVFSFEYLMRMYSCVEEPRFQRTIIGRLSYATKPVAIIDFLAIIPFFLEVFLHHLIDLRFLRSFRLMRLFKLVRYTGSTDTLFAIIRRELPILATSAFTLMLLVVLVASLGYLFEHEAQPDKFENIPTSIYWAVITLASVGYGDISPVTPMGRFMTTLMALIGLGLFAIPASILSSAFTQELQSQRQAVENQLFEMLDDGILTEEELAEVKVLARKMNMSEEQLEILIEKAKRETEERARNDIFIPSDYLASHANVAAAQFRVLFEQISRIAHLPNASDISRHLLSGHNMGDIERDLWQKLHGPPKKTAEAKAAPKKKRKPPEPEPSTS